MAFFDVIQRLESHAFFKRVKNNGYNYSFYFSTKENENERIESVIGLSDESLDTFFWRFSIFENGVLKHSYNSISHDLRITAPWFQKLVVEAVNALQKK